MECLRQLRGLIPRMRDLTPNEVDAKVDRPIEQKHKRELEELMKQVQKAKVDGLAAKEAAEDQKIIAQLLGDIDAAHHVGVAAAEGMQNWAAPLLAGLREALTELNQRIGEKTAGVDLSREDER